MDDGSSSDEQVQIICDYLIEEAKDNQSKETQKAKGDSSASIAQPSTSTGGWTNSKSSRNEQIKSPNPINTECDTDIRTILETILNSHIKVSVRLLQMQYLTLFPNYLLTCCF